MGHRQASNGDLRRSPISRRERVAPNSGGSRWGTGFPWRAGFPWGRSARRGSGACRGRFPAWRAVVLCGVLIAGGALVGCGPNIHVHTSYDERADFRSYGTFAMLEPDRALPTDPDVDPFLMQRLRRMVRETMLARGFREAAPEAAELRVGVMAVVRGRIVVYPSSFGYGYRWGSPWRGYDVREYDEGTIVIDLIDARQRAVVWRGTGTRVVTSRTSEEDLREVVWEILDEYPPGVPAESP